MAECLEIVTGPMELWWAAVGTTMPDVNDDAATGFTKIGTSGDENYTEDGVSVQMDQTIEFFRSLGSAHRICAFRTEQDILVTVTMADLSLAQARLAFNQNAVTTDTTPDIDILDLDLGLAVQDIALLVRGTGNSPGFAGANMQFELNRVVEIGAHEYNFVKGEPVGVQFEFAALLDDSGNVGRLVVETS